MIDVSQVIIIASGMASMVCGSLILYRAWRRRIVLVVRLRLALRRDPLLVLCCTLGYCCAASVILEVFVSVSPWLLIGLGMVNVS